MLGFVLFYVISYVIGRFSLTWLGWTRPAAAAETAIFRIALGIGYLTFGVFAISWCGIPIDRLSVLALSVGGALIPALAAKVRPCPPAAVVELPRVERLTARSTVVIALAALPLVVALACLISRQSFYVAADSISNVDELTNWARQPRFNLFFGSIPRHNQWSGTFTPEYPQLLWNLATVQYVVQGRASDAYLRANTAVLFYLTVAALYVFLGRFSVPRPTRCILLTVGLTSLVTSEYWSAVFLSDIFHAFFALLSVYALVQFAVSEDRPSLALSALMASFCYWSRATGLFIVVGNLLALLCWGLIQRPPRWGRALITYALLAGFIPLAHRLYLSSEHLGGAGSILHFENLNLHLLRAYLGVLWRSEVWPYLLPVTVLLAGATLIDLVSREKRVWLALFAQVPVYVAGVLATYPALFSTAEFRQMLFAEWPSGQYRYLLAMLPIGILFLGLSVARLPATRKSSPIDGDSPVTEQHGVWQPRVAFVGACCLVVVANMVRDPSTKTWDTRLWRFFRVSPWFRDSKERPESDVRFAALIEQSTEPGENIKLAYCTSDATVRLSRLPRVSYLLEPERRFDWLACTDWNDFKNRAEREVLADGRTRHLLLIVGPDSVPEGDRREYRINGWATLFDVDRTARQLVPTAPLHYGRARARPVPTAESAQNGSTGTEVTYWINGNMEILEQSRKYTVSLGGSVHGRTAGVQNAFSASIPLGASSQFRACTVSGWVYVAAGGVRVGLQEARSGKGLFATPVVNAAQSLQEWVPLSISGTLPPGTDQVQVFLDTQNVIGDSDFYLDDVGLLCDGAAHRMALSLVAASPLKIKPVVPAVALEYSFERGVSGWTSGGQDIFTWSAAAAYSGKKSLHAVTAGLQGLFSPSLAVDPKAQYSASAWVKIAKGAVRIGLQTPDGRGLVQTLVYARDGWTNLMVTTPGAIGVNRVQIYLDDYHTPSDFYVDLVQLYGPRATEVSPAPPALQVEPVVLVPTLEYSFEDGNDGWIAIGETTFSSSSDAVHHGTKSLHVITTGLQGLSSPSITVDPNARFSVSAWVKITTGAVRLGLQTPDGHGLVETVTHATDGWTNLSVATRASIGVGTVQMFVDDYHTASEFYLDQVQLFELRTRQ